MGLFDLFGGDSSSSQTSTTSADNQVGADSSGVAVGANASGTISIGSDAVATAAISSANQNLLQTENFLQTALTGILQNVTNSQSAANTAIAAAQQQATAVSGSATQTSSQNFIELVAIVGVCVVLFYWVKEK